jgi:hypothetical protein
VIGGNENDTVLIPAVDPKLTLASIFSRCYQAPFDSHPFEDQPKILPSRLLCVFEDDALRPIDVCIEEYVTGTIRIADEVE